MTYSFTHLNHNVAALPWHQITLNFRPYGLRSENNTRVLSFLSSDAQVQKIRLTSVKWSQVLIEWKWSLFLQLPFPPLFHFCRKSSS